MNWEPVGIVAKKICEFTLKPLSNAAKWLAKKMGGPAESEKEWRGFVGKAKTIINADGSRVEERTGLGLEYRGRESSRQLSDTRVMEKFDKETALAEQPKATAPALPTAPIPLDAEVPEAKHATIDPEVDRSPRELDELDESQIEELLAHEARMIREEGGDVEIGFEDDYTGLT